MSAVSGDVGKRYRNWCGTLFTTEESEIERLVEAGRFLGAQSERVRYIVGQLEKCPDSGRIHLQFYLQLRNPAALKSVKSLVGKFDENFGRTVHFSQANGSAEANHAYCSKEESRYVPEGGDPAMFRIECGQRDEGAGRGAGTYNYREF